MPPRCSCNTYHADTQYTHTYMYMYMCTRIYIVYTHTQDILLPPSLPLSLPPFTRYMVCGAWWYECVFINAYRWLYMCFEGRERWKMRGRETWNKDSARNTSHACNSLSLLEDCCTATNTCIHVDTVMWTLTVYLVANLHYLRLQCYMYGQQRLFFAQMAIRWWCDCTCTCTCMWFPRCHALSLCEGVYSIVYRWLAWCMI